MTGPLAADKAIPALPARRFVDALCNVSRRHPQPGVPEQAYLAELQSRGIQPISFHTMLESLFRVTPPTALIVDEAASESQDGGHGLPS